MKIKFYQIDSFTDKVFGGNPAGVCVLDSWLKESKMQQIASENNLVKTPSLEIEQLSNRKNGWLGFWVGHNSDGSFKNLVITKIK